jgi:3-hydroxymyristoyl/3-hydroxydecanoyl-(acyl carrier protein) dehydratase
MLLIAGCQHNNFWFQVPWDSLPYFSGHFSHAPLTPLVQLSHVMSQYYLEDSHALQCSACYLLHIGFFHGLFFNPEDGGNMVL